MKIRSALHDKCLLSAAHNSGCASIQYVPNEEVARRSRRKANNSSKDERLRPKRIEKHYRSVSQFAKFELKNENRYLVIVEQDEVILNKKYLAKMKSAYRNLQLSRRAIIIWMSDLFNSFFGDYILPDGKIFELDDDAIDRAFGKAIENDVDNHHHMEVRFISDWLKQDMPRQNGHYKLLARFRLMSIAMQLYDEELANSFKN